jgi:excisionase family DNA binding protein
MTLTNPHTVEAVEAAVRSQLREAAELLAASHTSPQLFAGDRHIALPQEVADALHDLLERFASGESVVIGSTNTLLTTSQVADVLGVSRTFVVQLIDSGALGVEYRGTHRRVRLADAVRYLEESRGKRRTKLDEIAELTAERGGYEDDPF